MGIAPGTALGTSLIVGAAPPECAGAAAGIAETAIELGGALGITLLGALGTALYRHDVAAALDGASPAARAGRDTLGSAVSTADRLPDGALAAAEAAFVHGMHVVAVVCAVLMAAAAVGAAILLRHVPPAGAPADASASPIDTLSAREPVAA